jgi:hypothetical protein
MVEFMIAKLYFSFLDGRVQIGLRAATARAANHTSSDLPTQSRVPRPVGNQLIM